MPPLGRALLHALPLLANAAIQVPLNNLHTFSTPQITLLPGLPGRSDTPQAETAATQCKDVKSAYQENECSCDAANPSPHAAIGTGKYYEDSHPSDAASCNLPVVVHCTFHNPEHKKDEYAAWAMKVKEAVRHMAYRNVGEGWMSSYMISVSSEKWPGEDGIPKEHYVVEVAPNSWAVAKVWHSYMREIAMGQDKATPSVDGTTDSAYLMLPNTRILFHGLCDAAKDAVFWEDFGPIDNAGTKIDLSIGQLNNEALYGEIVQFTNVLSGAGSTIGDKLTEAPTFTKLGNASIPETNFGQQFGATYSTISYTDNGPV